MLKFIFNLIQYQLINKGNKIYK